MKIASSNVSPRRARRLGPRALVAIGLTSALVAGCSNSTQSTADCSPKTAFSIPALSPGGYIALNPNANGSCFGFPANASSTDSAEYLVIAQSAAGIPTDSSPFVLAGVSPAGVVASYMPERRAWVPPPRPSNAAKFDAYLHSPARPWNAPPTVRGTFRPGPAHAAPVVGNLRSFIVCADFACDITQTVWARAEAVGLNVAIYIDTLSPLGGPTAGMSATTLDSLLQILDQKIYPIDINTFGAVSDIDTNGVVLALMSPVVNELVTRTDCEQNGFIAGFFFAGDVYPGLSQEYNNGEVYYSVVPDPDSVVSCAHSIATVEELMGSTFAHELEHMINFTQHVLKRSGGEGVEEGWLDEGLARYATELAARSFLPGDTTTYHQYLTFGDLYNAYQYLLDPGDSYLLLVADNGTLAESGASWLFVRFLVDQYSTSIPNLPALLVQSPYIGPMNITARTNGGSFQTIVTDWAMANYVSHLQVPGFTAPAALKYTSWSFRATYDTLHRSSNALTASRYPLDYPLVPAVAPGDQVYLSGKLRSGSGYYVRAMQGPAAQAFALSFTLDGTNALDTTVVPRLDVVRIR